MKKIRVLVVEDSLTVRRRIVAVLGADPDLEVAGEAADGKTGIELCRTLRPDVVTLDMMLPVMTGLAATEYIMAYCPTPILIVSASTNRGELFRTYDALAAGAVDVLEKPTGDEPDGVWEGKLVSTLKLVSRISVITHVRGRLNGAPPLATREIDPRPEGTEAGECRLVAIGCSTGGPAACKEILRNLPPYFPLPVLLVIHIGQAFGGSLAEWLNAQSSIRVSCAEDGAPLPLVGQGRVLIAPPGRHLVLRHGRLRLTNDPERHSCRPSVDVLFESIAQEMPGQSVACLLTGMGRDGAAGLLAIRRAGGRTLAQDEATSVVFGMPHEAIRIGAAEGVLAIDQIAPALIALASRAKKGGRMMPGILIVDDSLTVRMDLKVALESAGFATTLCETVAAARANLARETFSLIVLDVLLPDGNGVDLLAEIKATSATAAVPVMLLATEAEVCDRMRGLQAGADDYVGKPYDTAYVVGRAFQLAGPAGHPSVSPAAKLLVIDDSATFREHIKSVLEAGGYSVATAETGEKGLRMAVGLRPHMIIVDGLLSGGIDGCTVIQRLKQDAALRHTPCLLLTGSEDRGDELRALELGADAFLRKETAANILLARITATLRSGSTPAIRSHRASLLGPSRILAVDDSPTYLNEVAGELRQDGYDVILARSGQEALDLLRNQGVDCILLDVLMPGLSGHETCRRIKNTSEWRDIPLLMLTSLEENEAMVEGIGAGADDFILKSGDFEVLRARLRAQLRRRQYENENRRIREELLSKEVEAAQAKAAQQIAEARAVLIEELEEKNKELEAFSYSVSHDLRAPLRSINGFSRILLEEFAGQMPPEAHHYLQRVCSGAERMGQLIDDLLQLSRINRAELRRQTVDLSNLVRSVELEVVKRDPDRLVAFTTEDGLVAQADIGLMRVVFENLLGNAWKFTARTPQAHIEFGGATERNVPVYFVRDNGAGFNAAHAGKLFQPFQRLHVEADFPGTGIGLATVRRIIERHGGRVWAEGVVGAGATIFFTLRSNGFKGGN